MPYLGASPRNINTRSVIDHQEYLGSQADTSTNSGYYTFYVNYTPGNVSVVIRGVHMASSDYTATNGTDVRISTSTITLANDDVIEIIGYGIPSSQILERSDVNITGGQAVNLTQVGASSYKVGNTEVIDSSRIVDAASVKVAGTEVIDSNKSLNVFDVKVGGNTVIDSNRKMTGVDIVPTTNFTFRNKIINGNLSNPIKQRGISTITGATGYTYDRWYYDGSTYLYQGIEDKNVNNGTYVISWVGDNLIAHWALEDDNDTTPPYTAGPDSALTWNLVSKNSTFTINESPEHGKHLWIRFSLDTGGDFANLDKVMVEEGTVATPFEHRPYGVELALCQRYYWRQPRGTSIYEDFILGGTMDQTTWARYPVRFPVEMRANPSFSTTASAGSYANLNSGGLRVATSVKEEAGSVNKMSAIIEVYSPNLSTNQATTFRANANSTATFEFSAEL